jgi:uncharacterized protein YprB with RNaseH-like and TPR domain
MNGQLSLPGLEAPPVVDAATRLAAAFPQAAFFDIETAGLATGSPITLIVALQAGELHTFVKGENMDAFLDWVEHVELLVSFNGATFDVPRVLDHFRVPALPCPHLDLREVTKQMGIKGGLKKLEQAFGVERPADLQGMTGEDAEWLWRAWERDRDQAARDKLIRYCQADVIGLRTLAQQLLRHLGHLVEVAATVPMPAAGAPAAAASEPLAAITDDPLYLRLRERHRRQRGSGGA